LEVSGKLDAFVALPGTHWVGGWVDTRTGLDGVESLELLLLAIPTAVSLLIAYSCVLLIFTASYRKPLLSGKQLV
jgi:hypothetical protein